jgi:hypothetical protein
MERLTLLFRGAAVGELHAEIAEEMLGGNLSPLPGFEVLRAAIGDASRALGNVGFLPPAGSIVGGVSHVGSSAGETVLAEAQALCDDLELRDSRGQLVPTDWINVFGGRTADDPVCVMATFNQAPSAVPALLPRPQSGDGGSEPQAG